MPEKGRGGDPTALDTIESILAIYTIKNEGANLAIDSLLGGGYLRLPMSLTIVVVTLRALCQEWDGAGAQLL